MLDAVAESSDGVLAQLGEHLPYKQRVTGSSPVGPIYMDLYTEHGGIAQLARAHGSYPWCRGFESPSRYSVLESLENDFHFQDFFVSVFFPVKISFDPYSI